MRGCQRYSKGEKVFQKCVTHLRKEAKKGQGAIMQGEKNNLSSVGSGDRYANRSRAPSTSRANATTIRYVKTAREQRFTREGLRTGVAFRDLDSRPGQRGGDVGHPRTQRQLLPMRATPLNVARRRRRP